MGLVVKRLRYIENNNKYKTKNSGKTSEKKAFRSSHVFIFSISY